MIFTQNPWISFIIYIFFISQVHCDLNDVWNSNTYQEIPNTNKTSSASYHLVNRMTHYIFDDMIKNVRNRFYPFFGKTTPSPEISLVNITTNMIYQSDSYIPDMYLDSIQLVVKYGYKGESHTVKTQDGYLLTVHRIPCSKEKINGTRCQPVFLQHGLLASSSDYIITGPKKALAFILADAGYDVWLGNYRGNTYSRAHISKSKDSFEFWDFSWHELAMLDLSAMIDYVNDFKESKNDILYIGHSMGTTTLFALLSTKPEYNSKLNAAFTLAPVAYMKSLKSPIRLMSSFVNSIEWIRKHIGLNEFLPQNKIIKWLAMDCEINHFDQRLCENIIFVLCGFDESQLDADNLPVLLAHTPAGASTKTILHFAQEIRDNGKFQMYDYGEIKNKELYGQITPPLYNISNIVLPIAFFAAENDWLTALSDAQKFYNQLSHPIEFYKVPYKAFNHLDFIWAKDAPTLVYNKLMELMKKFGE